MRDLTAPLANLPWVDRNKLIPNDYNPNKVLKDNLELIMQSILTNGLGNIVLEQAGSAAAYSMRSF